MGDCQLILRYFALRDIGNIRGSMKTMLDRAMESRVNLDSEAVDHLKEEFISRLRAAISVFGPRPFLLPPDEKGRERLSAALYDASLVAIHRQWPHVSKFIEQSEAVKARLAAEIANPESAPILTAQGNTAQAVKDRISLIENVLLHGADV